MNSINRSLLTLFLFSQLSSCEKKSEDTSVLQSNIIAVGFNDSLLRMPVIWKNGVSTLLSSTSGVATGAATGVNDVFVCGYVFENGADSKAKVWRNGIQSDLNGNSYSTIANSIVVSGQDYYVVGYEYDQQNFKAKTWKNGIASSLTVVGTDTEGYDIFVLNNDVYSAGTAYNVSGFDRALVWKNGAVLNILGRSNANSFATGIFIQDTSVYVSGYETVVGNSTKAKLWKNGVEMNMNISPVNSFAKSVFVQGNDVYVAGYETGITSWAARLWKNGIAQHLTEGSTWAQANDVFVAGNDVYVTGFEYNDIGIQVSKIWKNNMPFSLNNYSAANSVTVSQL